jgi:DNA mismatch endonuclease (patch repair protein)
MDNLTPEQRHKCMSAIKSQDTKPEIFFRKALWKLGVRYRKNVKLFGKPDIAIKKYKLVIFIDGDYWHGNNWKLRGKPSFESEIETYSEYWKQKILRNIERDKKVNEHYESVGWIILRFWQSDVEKKLNECIIRTIETINQQKTTKS